MFSKKNWLNSKSCKTCGAQAGKAVRTLLPVLKKEMKTVSVSDVTKRLSICTTSTASTKLYNLNIY